MLITKTYLLHTNSVFKMDLILTWKNKYITYITYGIKARCP